ncbi:MAG: hypothetical protein R2828_18500 [Saprospiraceae bacterium]
MKNYRYLPLGLLTLVLAACSVETSESQPDISKIEKEVKEMFDNYVNQVNTEGIEEVYTYFSDDERFYWIEDGVIQYPDKASLISVMLLLGFYPVIILENCLIGYDFLGAPAKIETNRY